jgi:hypothetical protein
MSRPFGAKDKKPRKAYPKNPKIALRKCKWQPCEKIFTPKTNGQLHCCPEHAKKTLYKRTNIWAHAYAKRRYKNDPEFRLKNLEYQKRWRDKRKIKEAA